MATRMLAPWAAKALICKCLDQGPLRDPGSRSPRPVGYPMSPVAFATQKRISFSVCKLRTLSSRVLTLAESDMGLGTWSS